MVFSDGAREKELLVKVALKREAVLGLILVGWALVVTSIAFFKFSRDLAELTFFSWVLIIAVSMAFLSGVVRLAISQTSPLRSSWFQFDEGNMVFQLSADSRIQFLLVTANSGKEISWDIFSPKLLSYGASGFMIRIDHLSERFVILISKWIGFNHIPRSYGTRAYSLKFIRLFGAPSISIQAENKIEAINYSARLLLIEF